MSQFRPWFDEGHGGNDSGAVGGGMREDTRNLRLGEECERIARAQGWDPKSTREKDIFISLQERVNRAERFDADILVSIHHDWKLGEQGVIFANRHDPKASKRLADSINDELVHVAPEIPNGGIYGDRRGLLVLKNSDMPAVIVEASRVQDAYSITKMAKAIVRGICRYRGVAFIDPDAPKPASKPKPKKHRVLSIGSTGKDVEALQRYLLKKGYKLGRAGADGEFGDATKRAVVAYQTKRFSHKSDQDGVVGPKTWALIDAGK